MAQKILKVIFILAILFVFCIGYVSATGIDLNLPGTNPDQNQTTSNDMINNSGNQDNITNNPNDSQNDALNNPNASQNDMENNITNDPTINDPFANNLPSNPTSTETLGATNVSSQETGLGITNIINILLITVGVIIILLAIAIMLRLKG